MSIADVAADGVAPVTALHALDRPGAIVAGATYRALAVVRSLGRRGVRVCVLRTGADSLAGWSRYADRMIDWPRAGDAERCDHLLALADEHGLGGSVLIATDDEDAASIARQHPQLAEHFLVTVPHWETLRLAYDKRAMHMLATEFGLAQPRTLFPARAADLDCVDTFPVVIKPAFKAEMNALTMAKAWRANDRRSLLELYERACRLIDPETLMVQELVGGSGQFSFAALCTEGRVIASLTARRTRQYPLEFGRASTFVETVDEPSVELDARRLLAAMRLSGIVEVEYKRDPDSGANLLLDVNARAWGWQSLGAAAGVDFPFLLWRLATGCPVPELRARPGVGWMRMVMDLPAVARSLRAGTLSAPAYLRSFKRPLAHATFAVDDPLPALLDTALLGSIYVNRRRRDHAH
jgi:D-aspartate ligase